MRVKAGNADLSAKEAEIKDCKFNVRQQSKFKESLADIVRPCLETQSKKRTWDLTQWTRHLPSLCEVLGSVPTTAIDR